MRAVKMLGLVVLAVALLVAALFAGARFADGPIAMIPGGPLVSGPVVSEPVRDWTFARDIETIELQLEDESSSRTTWILVSEGAAFIPCSLDFPPGKTWHHRADEDGRAILRIEGRRYPVVLRRLLDSSDRDDLKAIVRAKYEVQPPSASGVWFFAIESRPG